MWIAAKLCQPSYLTARVARLHIEQQLTKTATAKVVLFRAPSGFGKTCALTNWLCNQSQIGWFNLSQQDNDPASFADYFLAALQKATHCSLSLQSNTEPFDLTTQLSRALSVIGEPTKPCYLVLEDFHHIYDKEIISALRNFIQLLPVNLLLVITSRTQPDLGLGKLRVQGLLVEFTHRDLAFSLQETECFLTQRTERSLSPQQIEQIHQQVDGWPAALELFALQLSTQRLDHRHDTSHCTSHGTSQQNLVFNAQDIWQYLIEEVFRNLDYSTQSFLLQCAILEQFNPALAREVTQHVDTHQMLETLVSNGLFIEPIQSKHNWFRYHRLFAQFLNHERTLRQPQLETTLNQRAARGWLKLGDDQQALIHARQAKDSLLIRDIVHRYGWQLLNQGQVIPLQKALLALPNIMIEQDFMLGLFQAWVACESGEPQTHRFKILAEQGLALHQQSELLTLKAKIKLARNPQSALELAQQALSQLKTDAYYSRIVATAVIAQANLQLGHLERALPLTQQCEKLARQYQTADYIIWAVHQQSQVMLAQGYPQAAFDLQDKALNLLQPEQKNWYARIVIQRAELQLSWGKVSAAKELILPLIKPHFELDEPAQLLCYALLIRIALMTNHATKARRYHSELDAKLTLINIDAEQRASIDLALLLYWRATQDHPAIRLWLSHSLPPHSKRNLLTQLQARNIARAQLYLSMEVEAANTLRQLQQQANQYQLVADQIKNSVLNALLNHHSLGSANNHSILLESLNTISQSGLFGEYLDDLADFTPLLASVSVQSQLDELTRHRIEQLLAMGEKFKRDHRLNFDRQFVTRLLSQQPLPESVRNSPLTQREWQVLGLIYAGLSNEQIAQQLDVAGTTIKTHIRNLYQKLNIANRKQAISTAETLVKLAEY